MRFCHAPGVLIDRCVLELFAQTTTNVERGRQKNPSSRVKGNHFYCRSLCGSVRTSTADCWFMTRGWRWFQQQPVFWLLSKYLCISWYWCSGLSTEYRAALTQTLNLELILGLTRNIKKLQLLYNPLKQRCSTRGSWTSTGPQIMRF